MRFYIKKIQLYLNRHFLKLEITLILYALHLGYPVHRDLTLVKPEELSVLTQSHINGGPTFNTLAFACGIVGLIAESDCVYEISSK